MQLILDRGDARLQELNDTLEPLEKEIRLGSLPDPAGTEPMCRGSLGTASLTAGGASRALNQLTGEVQQRRLSTVRRALVEKSITFTDWSFISNSDDTTAANTLSSPPTS